jgi:hypothetical protein
MNIFNNPYTTTQSWASQGALISWGYAGKASQGEVPLMISGLRMTYQQQITPIFPLNASQNTATKVNIKGAPQGSLELAAIYCPNPKDIQSFIVAASRTCVPVGEEMWISLAPFGNLTCTYTPAEGESTPQTTGQISEFKLNGVELVSLGLNIQAGEVTVVNMPLNFMFTSLEINPETVQAPPAGGATETPATEPTTGPQG